MARPLRLDHAGGIWHITSRGNERRRVFRDDADRRRFLSELERVVSTCRWRVHAYVLMGNHYHLLLETPEPNLSSGIRQLNGNYASQFNRRHGRVGHLFQGRFKSILVEKEPHLLELTRYVVLNPVRARIVSDVAEWKWSNYRATAGLGLRPPWLDVAWTLAQFGGGLGSRTRYQEFVRAGITRGPKPWKDLRGQIFLGSAEFRKTAQVRINQRPPGLEVPFDHRKPVRPSLDAIVSATLSEFEVGPEQLRTRRRSPPRLAVALLARREAGLRLEDFASDLGVRRWAASHLASQAEKLITESATFRSRVDRIRAELMKVTLSQT